MTAQSIFIVEDEIITARSIAKNIKNFGYQLAGIATSGSEAIRKIFKLKPNLVLIDIFLAKNDLDGITTAQKIRTQMNVPVIFLTAHSDRETLDRAKTITPFGYILKPFNKKELQISIEFALHKHEQEKQLQQREKLLSTILNATQDGVIAADAASKITYMNPAAQKMTGWQLNEAQDRQAGEILQIIDERNQEPIIDPIKQVLEEGEVIYLDEYAVLLQKNGDRLSIKDSASPILEKSDRATDIAAPTLHPEGAVLVFATRKNSAKADKQNNLAKLATDEQLNELSAYLMDVMLHELRSPLTVIVSTSQSLQDYRQRWTIEKQNQNFSRIQQATKQITRLLDDISTWAELGREEIVLQLTWINLVDFCEEILRDLRLIDLENHELIFSAQSEAKMFYLDPDILRYILNNLLLNGMKYSAPGSKVNLNISQKNNNLVLRVQDRGRGIPPAEQERIFEPLYRASNRGRVKGTGLGLAIANEYAQLCGGEIELEDSSTCGTTFKVSLPVQSEPPKNLYS